MSRVLYEVLIRFDAKGAVQGAHAQYADVVSGGRVIPDPMVEELPAKELGKQGVLGEAVASGLNDLAKARKALAASQEQVAALSTELADVKAKRDDADRQHRELQEAHIMLIQSMQEPDGEPAADGLNFEAIVEANVKRIKHQKRVEAAVKERLTAEAVAQSLLTPQDKQL